MQEDELTRAIKRRLTGKNTAPGPDGIQKKILALTSRVLFDDVRVLFTKCLRMGIFPEIWKRASLVLLQKEGKDASTPAAYRPICLLNEAGKLFERVIAERIVEHLAGAELDLNDTQFEFRKGLSTLDAVDHVRKSTQAITTRGGVAIAISLDISNAFNSLPWNVIREAMAHHEIPPYLRRVVGNYLSNRWIEYTNSNGKQCEEEMHRGVPQGSVLGPLLWNIGYDAVLRSALPVGYRVTCYADDTLILARGRDADEAIMRGEVESVTANERLRSGRNDSPSQTNTVGE